MDKNAIKIHEAIVHILDSYNNIHILSQFTLDLDDLISDFFIGHIHKILTTDDYKNCKFNKEKSLFYEEIDIYVNTNDLISSSQVLALNLFELMKAHLDIPSCDVVFIRFNYEYDDFLAILKLNYKSSFIHFAEAVGNQPKNSIIKQRTILPSMSQKLDEAIILNLGDYSIKLLEKTFDINGEKDYYLSNKYIGCVSEHSSKSKIKIISQTADSINKKYFNNDITKKLDFKKALVDNCEESGLIDIDAVINDVYESNIELKSEFKEKISKKGLTTTRVQFDSMSTPKSIGKHTIKTDTGFEINIPIDKYGNEDILEFINNPDGTISILIKKINSLL